MLKLFTATLISLSAVFAMAGSASAHTVSGGSSCAEMDDYINANRLPSVFRYIGRRESHCNNSVRSRTRDSGWFQLNDVVFRDHRMVPRLRACGVSGPWDVRGASAGAKQRQTCAARALYAVAGLRPWG